MRYRTMTGILSLLLCLSLWLSSGHTQTLVTAPVNMSAPTARGLVAWWRAQPGLTGGTKFYDLMGGPPLTLGNMATAGTTSGWVAPTRPGGRGEIRFDGSDDILATPTNSAMVPPYFSMLLWIKATASFAGDYRLLWEGINLGNIFVRSDGRLATYAAAATNDPAGSTTLAPQIWYHIALVMTTTQLQMYLNCRLESAVAVGGPNAAGPLYHTFGNKLSPANSFTGAMDDMKFYSRGLSQQELCTSMQESTRGEPVLLRPPLVAVGLASDLAPSGLRGNFFPFFGQP